MNNLYTQFARDLRRRTSKEADLTTELLTAELLRIAKKVHHLDEDFCNMDFTDEQRIRREQKRDKLISCANLIAQDLGALSIYHQSDPRGWPLYLIFTGDIPDGESADSWYHHSLAVPPMRN